jgi:hypothetical protein
MFANLVLKLLFAVRHENSLGLHDI